MAVTSGTRLGSYEILSPLGAGGMGEVYRAHDTKLGRDVALKIIPEAFALDADRVARFKREAQVLASLNDPHIAAIYGFEDSGATHALVLELVEGDTLAELIARRPEGLRLPGNGVAHPLPGNGLAHPPNGGSGRPSGLPIGNPQPSFARFLSAAARRSGPSREIS